MTIIERIYSASTSEDAKAARLAEKLARMIEDDIASNEIPPGGAIGSLRELAERYAVGRAATREAVALLERRGLGHLRPGPCGGFIVSRPERDAIAAELANYFRMAGVSLVQLVDARETVNLMAAELAAANRPSSRHLERLPSETAGTEECLHAQSEIAVLAKEPVIALFVACLNDLVADYESAGPVHDEAPGQVRNFASLRDALEAGDVERAGIEAGAIEEWLGSRLNDAERRPNPPAIETTRLADDRTLSTLVARKLAAEILKKSGAGQRLGSEWDLCERFSVSRATLRQAIRQLQDSGLVECRRGRGNGLVVRDLRGTGSIRLVLAFLISRQMDPKAAGALLFQLNRFVPALAVCRANREQRARLQSLLARAERRDPIDRYDLLRLVQCVSELADSPIIDLFSRCLAAYEARFHPLLAVRLPAQVQAEYFQLLRRLMDGMAPGEEGKLEWAKRESARVMMEMARSRPI